MFTILSESATKRKAHQVPIFERIRVVRFAVHNYFPSIKCMHSCNKKKKSLLLYTLFGFNIFGQVINDTVTCYISHESEYI